MSPSMAKTSKPRQAKAEQPQFSISLTLGDKTYSGSGATLLDALVAVPKPNKIVGKGTLTLTNGEKTRTVVWWPTRLKRLFYTSLSFKAIHAKQLSLLIK